MPERTLHEQGYALVVTDDGEDFVYEDVIDFGPLWSGDEMTWLRVRVEGHDYLIFEPPPEAVCLVRWDNL